MQQREAVRALLLDPTGAVLLMRVVEPMTKRPWWVTPGGGIDAGEDHPAALRRELREELGFDLAPGGVGPAVWHRRLVLPWNGKRIQQQETYYVVETDRFDPAQCLEGDAATGWFPAVPRWWTTDELRTSDEDIAPSRLADLLDDLRTTGAPATLLDIS
jgi:8-oxo-dGTP pyrophosphatase MutT (NUDIX family)